MSAGGGDARASSPPRRDRGALPAREGLIFSLGLFALAAQTLLFRTYLTAFEGSELGVGSFFASWLVWVALGALLGRGAARLDALGRRFPLLALLYLPAFVLQDEALARSRLLAGVAAYEVFPLHRMVALSFAANAPVSLLTGFLFTLACHAARGRSALAAARVYVLESLGGCAGGVAVTVLLAAGARGESVLLASALVLSLAAALARGLERRGSPLRRAALFVVPLACAGALAAGLDGRWARRNDRAAWERLLPAAAYRGSFTTAQGQYLYGEPEGQFAVMSWGGVSEVLPAEEHASEVLALTLAQQPAARRVLAVGPGALAICLRFLALPQIEKVTWVHPDPDYPRALRAVLPARYGGATARLEISAADVRALAASRPRGWDLVLLDLPDATTLVLNRYATVEFFTTLRGALAPGGAVALRISGGANTLGGELVHLGSSALVTLRSVFSRLVLKPGDESWLIAADGAELSDSPAVLRDRLERIEGAAALYPPEGLFSLYQPERIEFQLSRYREAAEAAGPELLENTDRHPKGLLYSLAAAVRRATGRHVLRPVRLFLGGGIWILAGPVLLYGLLRVLYLLGGLRFPVSGLEPPRAGAVDGAFLVFAAGLSGMALTIVLLLLYQSHFGSLYLHVGMASALFMLGLGLGGFLVERLLERRLREPPWILWLLVGAYLLVLGEVAFLLSEGAGRLWYGVLFALSGLVSGACFPLGAHRLRARGRSDTAAGAALETLDHLGGAGGAVLAGLVLIPFFGTAATLGWIALLVAANLVPALVPPAIRARRPALPGASGFTRPAGYVLAGLAIFSLGAAHLLRGVETGREARLLEGAARELARGAPLREEVAALAGGERLPYHVLGDAEGEVEGYIFGTRQLAGAVSGYGGPIDLAVRVDGDGTLRGFRVVQSRETPSYVERLEGWREGLLGRNLFAADPFAGIDAVTGATLSSDGIMETLERAGRAFASQVLGRDVPRLRVARSPWLPDRNFLALSLLTLMALGLRYIPRRWLRRLFLAAALVVAGFWLNLQYSTQQVFSLLGLELPPPALSGPFFLAVIMPLVVLLFGNVYCGWVCPFGAAQELVGELRPGRYRTDPGRPVWSYGRAAKYVLLAWLAVLFSSSQDSRVLGADPLITFFAELAAGGAPFWLGVAALLLSLPFRRFWCRNLCPAGAFLALLNRLRLLRPLVPATQPGRCDLGVRAPFELDCLQCDRCRDAKR